MEQQPIGQPGQRVVHGLVLERRLGLLALGDVAHADHKASRLLAHLGDGDFDRKHAFVASPAGWFRGARSRVGLRQLRPKLPVDLTARAASAPAHPDGADHFGGWKTEDLLTGRIARLNQAAVVDGQDALGDVVEHRPQVRFAFAEGRFGDAALDNLVRTTAR